jgi:cohesin loading factor subunit SCC2
MPRTATTFAAELSAKLLPMISRPSGRPAAVKEVIGAYCAVVTHLTRDYARLLQILRACECEF